LEILAPYLSGTSLADCSLSFPLQSQVTVSAWEMLHQKLSEILAGGGAIELVAGTSLAGTGPGAFRPALMTTDFLRGGVAE
jgi:uncharacterized protein YfaQ (DUF2300 family)